MTTRTLSGMTNGIFDEVIISDRLTLEVGGVLDLGNAALNTTGALTCQSVQTDAIRTHTSEHITCLDMDLREPSNHIFNVGANINIVASNGENTISSIDTTYTAGSGLSLSDSNDNDTNVFSLTANTISGKALGNNLENFTLNGQPYNGSAALVMDIAYTAGSGLSLSNNEFSLTANTISGKALGNNLSGLTAGTNLSFQAGTIYDGSTAMTINAIDTTYSAGDGLELTGATFGIKLDGTTLTKGSNGLKLTHEIVDYSAGDGLQLTGTENNVFTIDLDGSTLTKSTGGLKVAGVASSLIDASTNQVYYDSANEKLMVKTT